MMATTTISERIRRPEGIQRLGQALWMMVGERLGSSEELLWANSLLGVGGERLLWEGLREWGCLSPEGNLLARPLAGFLCAIWDAPLEADVALLWTLPQGLDVPGVDSTGYAKGVCALIRGSRERLTLLAPFLEVEGIGQLQADLLGALARGVSVVLVTQDANSLGSWASDSVESLRREARGLPGCLRVYSAQDTTPVLLHSKLAVSDGESAAIGSANLTGNALLRNLETGVVAGAQQAVEIERVIRAAIELGHVRLVFGTGDADDDNRLRQSVRALSVKSSRRGLDYCTQENGRGASKVAHRGLSSSTAAFSRSRAKVWSHAAKHFVAVASAFGLETTALLTASNDQRPIR